MGFIKNLIGGIISFLAGIFKIFNVFKKSEYFIEAEDAKSVKTPAPAKSAPAAPKPAQAESLNGKVAQPSTTVATAEPLQGKALASVAPQSSQPAPVLFAPNYQVSVNNVNSRRRPGPSMNRFLDMAKQVKAKP